MPTELVKRDTLEEIEEHFRRASADIEQAFALLAQAKQRLSSYLSWPKVLTRNTNDFDLERSARDVIEAVKRDTWREIARRTNVREVMTVQRARELDDQLASEHQNACGRQH